jgi:hypothetical protein
MLWPFFTKENPCPACSHHDWSCRAGQFKFVCMRVASDHPSKDGGYYHEYGDKKPANRPSHALPGHSRYVLKDAESTLKQKKARFSESAVEMFARSLGLSFDALDDLGCVRCKEWVENNLQFGFPMRDGSGKITGIRLRDWDGNKKSVYGSLSGCFYSDSPEALELLDNFKAAFICEGPTDAAALLTLGLFPIGRPSCNSCNEIVAQVLQRLSIRRAVIVVDNDEIKKQGNRPGYDGAIRLKKELGVPSALFAPPSPIKDVREFLNKGGTRQMIESDLRQKVFSR